MTVLQRNAASGVNGRRVGQFLLTAAVVAAVGVGAVFGIESLTGSESTSAANIEQIRAQNLRGSWLAQIQAQKTADMIEYHANAYAGSVAASQTTPEALESGTLTEFAGATSGNLVDFIAEQNATQNARYGLWGEDAGRLPAVMGEIAEQTGGTGEHRNSNRMFK